MNQKANVIQQAMEPKAKARNQNRKLITAIKKANNRAEERSHNQPCTMRSEDSIVVMVSDMQRR